MNRMIFSIIFPTTRFPTVKMKNLIVACLNNITPTLLLEEFNGNVATLFYELQYKVHKETDCVTILSLCHLKQQACY